MTAQKPLLIVLAGVNGAGKSSIGGSLFERAGTTWYNTDTRTAELVKHGGLTLDEANGKAWEHGLHLLQQAIALRQPHAFETTLGGDTMTAEILRACATHDVIVWFCGLASPELHLHRVKARVTRGGHDIPEHKICERFDSSRLNLVRLMPHVHDLQVFDNSEEAGLDGIVPNPIRLMRVSGGRLAWPSDQEVIAATPHWARPLLEAALEL